MKTDILVCVNDIGTQQNTVQAAASYARKHNACLTGMYFLVDQVNQYYVYEGLSTEVMAQLRQHEIDRAKKAEAEFNHIVTEIGCESVWLQVAEVDDPIQHMFYADLVFVGHNSLEKNMRFSSTGFINHLLLDTGRPIVVIPSEWSGDNFGVNALLGWNESRESARAMHEAIPLMQRAEGVDVVVVGSSSDDAMSQVLPQGIEASRYLTRKGINCELFNLSRSVGLTGVGSVILDHANKQKSDLIIVGGFSHSHLREWFLGGVTRHLLCHSSVPLLLVH